jgi:hypothetical protein
MQRVWQSHPRHADLKKVSNQKHPSTRRYLAGPLGTHPTGAGEGDDGAVGRSSNLTKTTTEPEPEEGLAT